jgi:hypothetical protein
VTSNLPDGVVQMWKQSCLSTAAILGFLGVFAAASHAQGRGGGDTPPPPCGTDPIQCPTPTSGSTFVLINLEPDSGSVCRFDPRNIQDLNIPLGGNVDWSFCSTCQVDMQVQLTVPPGPGLFDKFSAFVPIPESAHLAPIAVPCNGYGSASGFTATSSGDWKYTLKMRPAGTTGGFPDEIDPRLEIDDRGLVPPPSERPMSLWLERLFFLIVGVLAGAYLVRRMMRPAR